MRLTVILFVAALATSCGSVHETIVDTPAQVYAPTLAPVPEEKVVPDIPQIKPTFHENIDEIASELGIKKLRASILADNDIELRIWGEFGLTRLEGFILLRKNSSWSARKIGYDENRIFRPLLVPVSEPRSGWQSTWESMLQHKLLTLSDARSIKCEAGFEDGHSYVVELRKGANYRTYMFDNPDAQYENRCPDADEILAIARIVRDEYNGF